MIIFIIFMILTILAKADMNDFTVSMKGYTLKGKSDYTRLQITLNLAKLNETEKLGVAQGTFMLQLRNKGGLPVTKETNNYDMMPNNLKLKHDDIYFGQQVLNNCVLSVETATDGTDYATPTFAPGYVAEAEKGIWKARGIAVYPLKGDEAKGHRDSDAKLDLDDDSDLKGNVFIGYLLILNRLENYMRYTIESVDGDAILKKGGVNAVNFFMAYAISQTPEDMSYALNLDDARIGTKPFGYKKTVQVTDGGQYDEKGPIKTEVADTGRYLSESARAEVAKVKEEGKKNAEMMEASRKKLTQDFEKLQAELTANARRTQEALRDSLADIAPESVMDNPPAGEDASAEDIAALKQAEKERKIQKEEAGKKAAADAKVQEEATKQAESAKAQEEATKQAEAAKVQEEATKQAEATKAQQEEATKQAETAKAQEEAEKQAQAAAAAAAENDSPPAIPEDL